MESATLLLSSEGKLFTKEILEQVRKMRSLITNTCNIEKEIDSMINKGVADDDRVLVLIQSLDNIQADIQATKVKYETLIKLFRQTSTSKKRVH